MLLEMNLAASLMILIGIIIRSLFIHRISKNIFMLIWGLVAIRLLIPFSLPNFWNNDSIIYSVQEIIPIQTATPYELSSTPISEGLPSNPTPNHEAGTINWLQMIWISGVIISGLTITICHYKFRKQMSDAFPVIYSFKESIQIRESSKINSPLTYGFFKPVILMPKLFDWDDETQLRYVLTHEYMHIRRRDYLIKIVFALALCLHWFNPLVWVMVKLANRDIELACDEAVLKTLGRNKRGEYIMALLKLEEKRNHMSALAFSRNATEERIQVMIKMKKKTSILGAVMALTLVGGAMTVFATSDTPNRVSPQPQTTNQTELVNRGFTLKDYEEARIELDRQLTVLGAVGLTEEQIANIAQQNEQTLEYLRNDGTGIFYDDGGFVIFDGDIEVATYESFKLWMNDFLNREKANRELSDQEIADIQMMNENILASIKDGLTVVLTSNDQAVVLANPDEASYELFYRDDFETKEIFLDKGTGSIFTGDYEVILDVTISPQ